MAPFFTRGPGSRLHLQALAPHLSRPRRRRYDGPLRVEPVQGALADDAFFYHYQRPHYALDLMTPMQYLQLNRTTEAGQSHMS